MAKFRIGTIETPDRAAVEAALQLREPAEENEAVAAAERRHKDLRDRCGRLSAEVVRLREAVARNAAPPQALESKLLEFSAAEQASEPAAQAIARATAARQAALQDQANSKIDLAIQFRNELQEVLDRHLNPVLEEIKTLERQLDQGVRRLSGGRVPQVPALTWPTSNVEDLCVR